MFIPSFVTYEAKYLASLVLQLRERFNVRSFGAGEVLHIPSNLPHRAEAIETTRATDVFCPRRDDWLAGTDSYLRGR